MARNLKILNQNSCTACAACLNICNHGALEMVPDKYGFLYPKINSEKCVNCGLCERICPELNFSISKNEPLKAYALYTTQDKIFKNCASGGVASIASKFLIEKGGVVYGCSLKNCDDISHIRINDIKDISLLSNSKYVQSDIDLTYKNVLKDLNHNKSVLFVGTPCQISGLKHYLKRDFSNLLCIDLICHGVPSKKFLADEIKYFLGDKYKVNNLQVLFRWKEPYGIRFGILYSNKDKTLIKKSQELSPYMCAFQNYLSIRESCYQCKYATTQRIGDLTIGDFWGLGLKNPSIMDVNKGVSLLIINTKKGNNLWENIKIHFIYEERSISEALYNPHLKEPPLRPINKDEFLYDFSEKGLYYAVKKNAPLFKAYNSSLGHLKLWSKNWLRQTKKREKIFLIINNFYQKYIVNRIYGS